MTDTSKARSKNTACDGSWGPAFREAGVAFVAAALLLSIFYSVAFRWMHPEFVPFMDREASRLIAAGKDLIPVSVGESRIEGGSTVIQGLNGDEAILALARSFQAEDYPFIKVNLEGLTRHSKFKILWRQADDLSQTHSLELNRSGDEVTQVAMVYGDDNYRGRIVDIALLFYDRPASGSENNGNVDISVHSIELRPFSLTAVTEQILEDWTNPPSLNNSSINTVTGNHRNTTFDLNAAATACFVFGCLLLTMARRKQAHLARATFIERDYFAIFLLALQIWISCEIIRWPWRVESAWHISTGFKLLEIDGKHSSP